MPNDLGSGIFEGLSSIAQGLQQKFARDRMMNTLSQFSQQTSGVPTYDPRYQQAIGPLLAQYPQLAEALTNIAKSREPQFTKLSPGEAYGSTQVNQQTGQPEFHEQGVTPYHYPPMFGFDAQGNPTVGIVQNGQIKTAASPITTTQMQNSQTAKARQQANAAAQQQKIDLSKIVPSGVKQNEQGILGVTVYHKDSGTSEFVPTDTKGMPKVGASGMSASTRTMLDAAPTVKSFVDKINGEVDQNAENLGPAKSRWREYMAGTVGAADPSFTKLRTNMGLLQTLLMRMHVGARGGEYIMKHFQDLIDSGKQSPENLHAALGQIGEYADELLKEKANAGQPAQTVQPTGGATHRYNPSTGKIEEIK